MTIESKPIRAGNQLIHQTIYNQAGSIQKALLEYIMNSVDAKASEIRIFIDQNGIDYTIADNGDGFGNPDYTVEEKKKCIDEVFGSLGFDHGTDDENYRVYGKFGIGRAQLWAFSRNTWHTHDMTMDVDIKNHGLKYDIQQIDNFYNGCHISGQFYEPIHPNDLVNIKRELSKMAAFAPIDVYFNDTKINRRLSEIKSTLDVEHLHIELKQSSTLKVYNQGIFVREYSNYTFGTGGVVISDVGHPFELNAARNDILQSRCKLWKKLKQALDTHLGNLSKKSKLTDDTRKSLLNKIAAGQYHYDGDYLIKKPLIKMVNNRYASVEQLINGKPFSIINEKYDPLAEHIQTSGTHYVLLSDFTEALGVSNEDFVDTLKSIKSDLNPRNKNKIYYDDIESLKSKINNDHYIIPTKKLTKRQKLFLESVNLNSVQNLLVDTSYIFDVDENGQRTYSQKNKQRKVFLGKSDVADAWTDGSTMIVINEDLVKNLDKGAGYALQIINTLVHEYEHDDDNNDMHSLDFYKNCHDTFIDKANNLFMASNNLLNAYTSRLTKNDFVIPKRLNRSLKTYDMI